MIQRELPSLLSKEFLPNQENDRNLSQSSNSGCCSNASPDLHTTKWRSLFAQMEKALSEEGKYLVSLNTNEVEFLLQVLDSYNTILSMHLLRTP